MGKLLEALRKHMDAAAAQREKPLPRLETDPVKTYERIIQNTQAEYKAQKARRIYAKAFESLSREQQLRFFDENASQSRKKRYASAGFLKAYSPYLGNLQAMSEFLSKPETFGRPLEETLPMMEDVLQPNQRKELQRSLDEWVKSHNNQPVPPAIRAALIFKIYSYAQRSNLAEQIATPASQARYARATFERIIQQGSFGETLINSGFFAEGKTWQSGVEYLENLLGPEQTEALAAQIDGIRLPEQDPDRMVRPYAGQIDAMRGSIEAADPQAEEKRALLALADTILTYPTNEYLTYLSSRDSDKIGKYDVDKMISAVSHTDTVRFLQGMGGGLIQKLPHERSNVGPEYQNYSAGEVLPLRINSSTGKRKGVELSQQELEKFRGASSSPINPEVRKDILDIIHGIEEIGEKKYWLQGVVDVVEGPADDPQKVRYKDEQGNKKYAFWPLVLAKGEVRKAVEAGDWEKLRQATAEYLRIKNITDRMMQAATRTGKIPLFPANMNSTRPESEGFNPMPVEYLEDYVGHNRVNGAFSLFALSKNTGIPVETFLDDPGAALRQIGKDFRETKLLSSRKGESVASQLAKGLNQNLTSRITGEWSTNLSNMTRGLDTAAFMLPTEEERRQMLGRNYCAAAYATYEVGKETVCMDALGHGTMEKKRMIAQLAILGPDEEFDLVELGTKLSRPDWYKTVNPFDRLQSMRKNGPVDYAALVTRSKDMLSQIREVEETLETPTSFDVYEDAALQNYRVLMRTAPASERETQGYRQMQDHARELQANVIRRRLDQLGLQPRIHSIEEALNEQEEILSQEKSGWFLSKTDSPEYRDMMKGIRAFRTKLELLRGQEPQDLEPEELERIRNSDAGELLIDAIRGCTDYSSIKTQAGTGGFLHQAGADRNSAALRMAQQLSLLGTTLGVVSPAIHMRQNVACQVLKHRNEKGWETARGEACLARVIFAMSLQYRGVPHNRQKELLEKENLEAAVKRIRREPAFRRMIQNEGLSGALDKLMEGTAVLTDAYSKAAAEVEQTGKLKHPEQRTNEQRIDYWRQRKGAVAEDAPAAPEAAKGQEQNLVP